MFAKKLLNNATFYVIWYCKDKEKIKYNTLFGKKEPQDFADTCGSHLWAEMSDGTVIRVKPEERKNIDLFLNQNKGSKLFGTWSLNAQGSEKQQGYEYEGKTYYPPKGTQWKTSYPDGLNTLKNSNRLQIEGDTLRVRLYYEDYPVTRTNNLWTGIGAVNNKIYVVQTPTEIPQRCMLMTTDPGDLVLDITCGSGTTPYVAEQWGRRWIACDTSRISIALAKQRIITAMFDYYRLAHPELNVQGGFVYKKAPHRTIESIVNGDPTPFEILYDDPEIDRTKVRVAGAFTMEAIPSPTVKTIDDLNIGLNVSAKQSQWRDELKASGILTRSGEKIQFSRIEAMSGTQFLQADAETKEETPRRAVICFAGETRPLDSRMVRFAIEEAETIHPSPKMIIFCAFQFDPEASKNIDETVWPGVQLLQVHMNTDLLTDDLKKKSSGNQSFWMVGQPDVVCKKIEEGVDKGKYQVIIRGFDYYEIKTGTVQSGNSSNIAMWMLDTDYDGMSLNPSQLFFPMAGPNDGWSKLAKTLKVELDQELIEMYRGVESIPFSVKPPVKIAVKIIDNRGIESLKVITIGE